MPLPKPVTLTPFSDGKIYRNIYLYMGSEKVLSPVPSGKVHLLTHLRKKFFMVLNFLSPIRNFEGTKSTGPGKFSVLLVPSGTGHLFG